MAGAFDKLKPVTTFPPLTRYGLPIDFAPMYRLLLFLTPLLLQACQTDITPAGGDTAGFFDLAAYMDEQSDSLTAARTVVTKTIVLNGQEETKELRELDFSADLRLFREADINKPAWIDKYRREERTGAGSTTEIYTALDSNLQTRRLAISRRADGAPTEVSILRRTGTVLSEGDHQLTYRPASGYRIRTLQDNRFGDDLDAIITVDWVQKKR